MHGSGSLNPGQYGSAATMPDESGAQANGFGRLFTIKSGRSSRTHDEKADPYNPGLLPHPSPIYDLRLLGEKMVEPKAMENSDEGNSNMPAGYTFLGQFIDHDITLDTISSLNERIQDSELSNARTPDLDLDCVYGGGPERDPYLYNLPYLRVGDPLPGTDNRFDLLRTPAADENGNGRRALIGDPRNDENFAVSQMQGAFIAFHNRMAEHLGEEMGVEGPLDQQRHSLRNEIFERARELTIHYYHRVIAEDFMPRLIGIDRALDMVSNGRDFYFPNGFLNGDEIAKPFIPVEFSVAAYRYGHSQVRQEYRMQDGAEALPLFDPTEGMRRISGFSPIRDELVIDWRMFFDIGERPENFNFARIIDPFLPRHLATLDMVDVVGNDDLGSLAARNLNRGRIFRLPSGQSVAGVVLDALGKRRNQNGDSVLSTWRTEDELGNSVLEPSPEDLILQADLFTEDTIGPLGTPLWYYVLQEAREFGGFAVADDDAAGQGNTSDGATGFYDVKESFPNVFVKQSRQSVNQWLEQQPKTALGKWINENSELANVTQRIAKGIVNGQGGTDAVEGDPAEASAGHTLGPVGGNRLISRIQRLAN